jgi:hypothetical protein
MLYSVIILRAGRAAFAIIVVTGGSYYIMQLGHLRNQRQIQTRKLHIMPVGFDTWVERGNCAHEGLLSPVALYLIPSLF